MGGFAHCHHLLPGEPFPEGAGLLVDFWPQPGTDYGNRAALVNASRAAVVAGLKGTARLVRFNGWWGCYSRCLELSADVPAVQEPLVTLLQSLGWTFELVDPVPGFVTARTLAMIINEAYFALEEGIGTREAVDTAMKLGTGYPLGPFEWSRKIGLAEVASLLNCLAANDDRYTPCNLLLEDVKHEWNGTTVNY